jgi:hypothetical protein
VKIVPPTPVPVMLGGVVEQILSGLEMLSYLNALPFRAEGHPANICRTLRYW